MKKIICIILSLVILVGMVGCGNKKPTDTSSKTSSDTSSAESILDDLQNSSGTSSSDPGGFDNTDEGDETPTPGENSSYSSSDEDIDYDYSSEEDTSSEDNSQEDSSADSSSEDNSSDDKGSSDSDISNNETNSDNSSTDNNEDNSGESGNEMEHSESLLKAKDLQYYYQGNGYAYGIGADDREIIAYLESDGELIDVFGGIGGIGTYKLNAAGIGMFRYKGIKQFNRVLVNGDEGIEVEYELEGVESNTSYVKTTYVFHTNSISVSAYVDASSALGNISASYTRSEMATVLSTDERFMYEWVYPENGDYPFTNSDGVCTVCRFDDYHSVYFYNRDINQEE